LEGARGRKKWFAPTSFRNEVSFLNDTAGRDGMFIELIVPMNSTGGRERDVMDEDIIAAGMHPVQMIADSKHHCC
jgi:hypothetical protein